MHKNFQSRMKLSQTFTLVPLVEIYAMAHQHIPNKSEQDLYAFTLESLSNDDTYLQEVMSVYTRAI